MSVRILVGDVRERLADLPDGSVHCCVTSPPYLGLRDYGVEGQIGLEATPDAYIAELVAVFGEVRRVLRDDGTVWLNLGDSYFGNANSGGQNGARSNGAGNGKAGEAVRLTGLPSKRGVGAKPKDLLMIPARVALALQADGWWLRSDIIWHKPNPMPESVTDRPTSAHEHVFLLAKSERYFYDGDAVREPYSEASIGRYATSMQGTAPGGRQPNGDINRKYRDEAVRAPNPLGRNLRNVWTVPSEAFPEAHFATFPPALIEPCIKAGCPLGGTVLDPFFGAGTTGLVADRLGRSCVGIELNPAYAAMAERRIQSDGGMFADVSPLQRHGESKPGGRSLTPLERPINQFGETP